MLQKLNNTLQRGGLSSEPAGCPVKQRAGLGWLGLAGAAPHAQLRAPASSHTSSEQGARLGAVGQAGISSGVVMFEVTVRGPDL